MNKVLVGQIVRAFGIKGELKVRIITDFPEQRFEPGNVLKLDLDQETLQLKIKAVRFHQGFALLLFEGYEDINLAEKFVKHDLYIDPSQVIALDEGYYTFELIDLAVYADDKYVGKVTAVEDYPAHSVLRVKTEGRDVLIPYVDAFVKNVDLKTGRIDIEAIEGLL